MFEAEREGLEDSHDKEEGVYSEDGYDVLSQNHSWPNGDRHMRGTHD